MLNKRMPVRRKATGNRDTVAASSWRPSRITGRIPAHGRTRKGADVSRWLVKTNPGKPPEPKGKLDTDGERT